MREKEKPVPSIVYQKAIEVIRAQIMSLNAKRPKTEKLFLVSLATISKTKKIGSIVYQ